MRIKSFFDRRRKTKEAEDPNDLEADQDDTADFTEEEVHARARAIALALLKPQRRENEDG